MIGEEEIIEPKIPVIEFKEPKGSVVDRYDVDLYEIIITDEDEYIVKDVNISNEDIKNIKELLNEYLYTGTPLPVLLKKHRISETAKRVVNRELNGYSILDPTLKDKFILDIHAVHDRPVKVLHQRWGILKTNIHFEPFHLNNLLSKLATRAGKSISAKKPYVSMIDPFTEHRVSGIIMSDVSMGKVTVSIRKKPENPWTVVREIKVDTLTPLESAFLWQMIVAKMAVMVIGPMLSGKTSMINALLGMVPPEASVMTVEDTPELLVPSPYWTRTISREAPEEGESVSFFELVKLSLRLSEDYVIVGEVRGEEGRDWAQAIMLGHGGLTSFHAGGPEEALNRLVQPPINISPQALNELKVLMVMHPLRSKRGLIRRSSVYLHHAGELLQLFKFDPARRITIDPNEKFLRELYAQHPALTLAGIRMGMSPEEMFEDLQVRERIIREALEREFKDYKELNTWLYERYRELSSHA